MKKKKTTKYNTKNLFQKAYDCKQSYVLFNLISFWDALDLYEYTFNRIILKIMMTFQKYDFFHQKMEACDVWAKFLDYRRKIEAETLTEKEIENEIANFADMTL